MITTEDTMTRADLIAEAWMQNKMALSDLGKIIPPDPETMIGLAHVWEHLDAVDELLNEAMHGADSHGVDEDGDGGDGDDMDDDDTADDEFDREIEAIENDPRYLEII